jgi:mono/diheme cytochrome c family protein
MKILIVLVVAVAIASAAMAAMRRGKGKPPPVPPALRPGDIDAVLESDRLTKIQWWGFAFTFFFAIFLPAYWMMEPGRMASADRHVAEDSITRGQKYFALRQDPVTGAENLNGKECARCHGTEAQGGTNDFLDTATGQRQTVNVPELQTVFTRYATPPAGFKDARAFISETIERGRPGTDMPTWGNQYGGPLNEQEIADIVDWLEHIQKTPKVSQGAGGDQIFNQFCVSCHGAGGSGGIGPSMKNGSETKEFPNIQDHIAFVTNGSKAGQPYGAQGKTATGRMPAWQGTLTPEQIKAVVDYERSL